VPVVTVVEGTAVEASERIRVLVVDDHALFLQGLETVLNVETDIIVVGRAGDGSEAVSLATDTTPDIVLMDVRMPGVDGIEATSRIIGQGLRSRVIILTTFDLDEYAFAGLRAGASGFLLKDVPPNDLLSGIRAVATGDAVVSPSVTRRLLDSFAHRLPGPHEAPADARLDLLTAREREVLLELARGCSNAEIAAELVLSEATVKTHVRRILAKLQLRDRVQAVVFAYDIGLARPPA
jgi:DNA-binding NarL/FixJ family response regulator